MPHPLIGQLVTLHVTSTAAVDLLLDGLRRLVDVEEVPLTGAVARLTIGRQSVLYIDIDSPQEDKSWAMLDALQALILGPDAAESARRVPRLYSVG